MAQVDQNIDFRYLRHLGAAATARVEQPIDDLLGSGPAFTDARSSDEDGGYDLTSEVFLENVDDEFMPNFPTPDSVPGAVGGQVHVTVSAGRSAALVQRMNQFRLGTSPRHTHRRYHCFQHVLSCPVYPGPGGPRPPLVTGPGPGPASWRPRTRRGTSGRTAAPTTTVVAYCRDNIALL